VRWDSLVTVVTGYETGWTIWVRILARTSIFLFAATSRPVLGPTQPPIHWVLGAPSPGVKRLDREADLSSPI